jgi:carbamoyltransferase
MKNILSVSRNHDAGICYLKDGETVFHTTEERHSREKQDGVPFWALLNSKELIKNVDGLCITATNAPAFVNEPRGTSQTFYDVVINKLTKLTPYSVHYFHDFHHLTHASGAFYNSGFKEAVCVVFDGSGSFLNYSTSEGPIEGRETQSIFIASYPANFECIHKKMYSKNNINYKTTVGVTDLEFYAEPQSFGYPFDNLGVYFGLGNSSAGKVMGLASYGKQNTFNLVKDGVVTSDVVSREFGSYAYSYKFPRTDTFQEKADLAYSIQLQIQQEAINYVLFAIKKSGLKNVCLSGGYALNCSFNYELLKHLPEGVNLYVEPAANDSGTSLGAAKYLWHSTSGDTTIRPQLSPYLGIHKEYEAPADIKQRKVTYQEVATLIRAGNIVAMYQGRSEVGPRALGNRSILFDPTHKNGKDIVNTVKGREFFRPFAGTVLEENASEWFDMRGLKSSPFMMFAVNAKTERKEEIPSIVHVDGSCRIQTINKQQNPHFYNLISAFKELTGVPILFNTSFNLAGDPMVESIEDAVDTLRRSKLEYLYLPEKTLLLEVPNT